FRDLLLPGHRILPARGPAQLRAGRPGRTQDRPRFPARPGAQPALDRRPGLRRCPAPLVRRRSSLGPPLPSPPPHPFPLPPWARQVGRSAPLARSRVNHALQAPARWGRFRGRAGGAALVGTRRKPVHGGLAATSMSPTAPPRAAPPAPT